MKILFLQNVLFDYRVGFYNQLAKQGFEITVVHSGAKNDSHCDFEQIIAPKTLIFGLHIQRLLPPINDFDIVVAMFDLHWLMNIVWLFRRFRGKYLLWGHGLGKNTCGNYLRKWLVNKSEGLILYNEEKLNTVKTFGFNQHKLYSANNTLYISNAGRSPQHRHQFLFVGRLQARKRVDVLIKAFAQAVATEETTSDISLTIIGDGDQKTSLELLAKSLRIEAKVAFLGATTSDQALKQHFDKAIAYVSPGPMGLGVNHAFAYGVPTLSNSIEPHGPETWLLNQNNSFWYDAKEECDQVTNLSHQLTVLMAHPELAEKKGKQAFKDYQAHCSMDVMVAGFIHAFNGKRDD
ncbi:glycosyltransferase family 4 protein [Colwellia sp. MEBiC06753]